LVKCVYDPEEQVALIQAVLDYLDRALRKAKPYDLFKTLGFLDRVFRKINAGMLALKDSGFKEENEWRLVVEGEGKIALDFRPGRFGIMPYRKLPLCKQSEKAEFREVYIGPHPEPDTAREALDSFLSEHAKRSGHPAHDRIKDSSIPYRY
jgi:hypothetical protein